MEGFCRIIRTSRIRELSISLLRIIPEASPSLRSAKWKNLTDLYAIPRRDSIEFHFCVQLQEHLRPHETGNGNILQIYTQSRKETLLNLDFAYNFMGISVPTRLEMEISYRFVRNLARCLYRISHLRIIPQPSPSPLRFLYAVIKFAFLKSLVCV